MKDESTKSVVTKPEDRKSKSLPREHESLRVPRRIGQESFKFYLVDDCTGDLRPTDVY